MQFRAVHYFSVAAGLALVLSGRWSFASDANGASDDSGALQEVVVTARRVSENLERVPVSVTALSASALSEQHVTNEQELQSAVPGLTTVAATSTNQLAFSIRGQALDTFSNASPTVLTYFNEFQTGGVVSTTYFDLASIQVLKGPQGTLFGRNDTGGAVLYTTTVPGKDLTGYFNYTAGNYNEQKLEGAITLPLGTWASVRLAAEDEHRAGYEHNVYLNVNEGSIDNLNLRGTLLLTPLDSLENTTTIQYGRQGGDSGGLKLSNVNVNCPPNPACTGAELFPAGLPTGGVYPAKLASYNGLVNFLATQNKQPYWNIFDDSTSAHSAQLREAVNKTTFTINEGLSIKNIVGFNEVTSNDKVDVDGSPYELIVQGTHGGPGVEGFYYPTKQYSDELQLTGVAFDKRLNYVLGGYYGRDFEGLAFSDNIGCGSIAFPVTPTNPYGCASGSTAPSLVGNYRDDEKSRALFGQATYEVIDNLKVTGGYRETWEDLSVQYRSPPVPTFQAIGVPVPPAMSEREPSWTLGLDYQLTPETLIYITQRGGFRAGGFNGTSTSLSSTGALQLDSFQPEIARDLELGIKFEGRLGNFPLRVNADVYEERVRDAQRVIYAGVAAFTLNVAKSQTDGFELDALVDLTPWLEVGVNYAYTDARYTDGTTHFSVNEVLTGGIATETAHLGIYGFAPKNSGSLYLRFAHDLPNALGKLVVRQDIYSQSSFYYSNLAGATITPANGVGALDPETKLGGYTLLNARAEWNNIAGSNVHVAAYVRNMLNKQYAVGGLGLGAVVGVDSVILGTPRMAAVEVGVNF